MTATTLGRWGNVDETAKAQVAGPSLSREKYWGELSIEEKIERMREIIKQKDDTINFLRDSVFTLDRQLRHHSHSDKKVMVDIDEVRGVPDIRDRYPRVLSDEVYF